MTRSGGRGQKKSSGGRPAGERPSGERPEGKGGAGAAREEAFPPRLKPRRGLFVVLLLGFFLWVGALVALYWKTVYPLRHPGGAATAPVAGSS